jgi:DNA modification methylase
LVAAKKLRRQWIGIEIDPHWVAIARQRLGRFDHSWTLEERVARLEFQTRAIASKVRRIDQRQQLSLFG